MEFHDGVEIIEEEAFEGCRCLKAAIKLPGIKIIKAKAFRGCRGLTGVEFGDKLETIEKLAFNTCNALKKIRIPTVRTVERAAFCSCRELSDVECGEGLRTLESAAFCNCPKLERIVLPLKGNIEDNVFVHSQNLTTVELAEGIHNTVASLHLESWRNEMTGEINRINQVLPAAPYDKTGTIQQWMRKVIHHLNQYKEEHRKLLKDATTLVELALWKANLDDNEGGRVDKEGVRTTRGSRKRARKEICVTSGASIVIKNVLPFLKSLE